MGKYKRCEINQCKCKKDRYLALRVYTKLKKAIHKAQPYLKRVTSSTAAATMDHQ